MTKAPGRELADPMASVRAYIAAEKSPNTRRAYRSDWANFTAWCERVDLAVLPAAPATVARYLAQLADNGLASSSIERRGSAIRYAHKAAGHEPPTNSEAVKATMRGIRRTNGVRVNRKAPAVAAAIGAMLEHLPPGLIGIRDRALLLIAFAAALRRSELVALDVADLQRVDAGVRIQIRKSKTDQEGEGQEVPVPHGVRLKPIAALDAWLAAAAINDGAVFRPVDRHGRVGAGRLTDRSVARIIKRAAKACGLDERTFSGHSPRAGFVTSALDDGVDLFKVMGITRHVDVGTLKIYDRRARGFDNHAGKGFL